MREERRNPEQDGIEMEGEEVPAWKKCEKMKLFARIVKRGNKWIGRGTCLGEDVGKKRADGCQEE